MLSEQIADQVVALPIAERLELAGRLWDSVITDQGIELTPSQKDFIEARIREADSNQDRQPAEDVFAELRSL